MTTWPGHAVLQVPVPALEGVVRERYEWYDASLDALDPGHVHAHVTVLGPVPATLTPAQDGAVSAVCAETPAIDLALADVATFPNGVIHVLPADPRPFDRLTDAMAEALPGHPPYGGMFRPVPHVTIDATGPGVDEESVRRELATVLPARCRADRVELVWYRRGETRVLRRWTLG